MCIGSQGSGLNRADLRAVNIEYCFNTAILSSASSSQRAGEECMNDSENVLAYLNIKAMHFDQAFAVRLRSASLTSSRLLDPPKVCTRIGTALIRNN